MSQRVRKPKVTKADLDRLVDLVRALGLEVAEVEAAPGSVKLVTTAGRELTLPDDTASLDAELRELDAKYGPHHA